MPLCFSAMAKNRLDRAVYARGGGFRASRPLTARLAEPAVLTHRGSCLVALPLRHCSASAVAGGVQVAQRLSVRRGVGTYWGELSRGQLVLFVDESAHMEGDRRAEA